MLDCGKRDEVSPLMSKVYRDCTAGLDGVLHDNMTIAAGFGLCGIPENLIAIGHFVSVPRSATSEAPRRRRLMIEKLRSLVFYSLAGIRR